MSNRTVREIAADLQVEPHFLLHSIRKNKGYLPGQSISTDITIPQEWEHEIYSWFKDDKSTVSEIEQHLSQYKFSDANKLIKENLHFNGSEIEELLRKHEQLFFNQHLKNLLLQGKIEQADKDYESNKVALQSISEEKYPGLKKECIRAGIIDPIESLHREIQFDKETAVKIQRAAKDELGSDLTGDMAISSQHHEFLSHKQTALRNIANNLFFAKVEVNQKDSTDEIGPVNYFVTKNRICALLGQDDWHLISWTSPVTSYLMDEPVSSRVSYHAPKGVINYEILSTARYGAILPSVIKSTYNLTSGSYYVEHEQNISIDVKTPSEQTIKLPQEKPVIDDYEAKGSFSLNEIIELADKTQRSTMHLPFYDSMVIEGPPGSGKTSIGIMRIPCLIDRQWEELGLNESKDAPFHRESTMRVLVNNDEMVKYLDDLTKSIGIQKVKVMTIRNFLRDICRNTKTLKGRQVEDSDPLAFLKTLPSLCEFYGQCFTISAGQYWDRVKHQLRAKMDQCDQQIEKFYDEKDDYWYVPKNIKAYRKIEKKLRDEHLKTKGLGGSLYHTIESWAISISRKEKLDSNCSLALYISKWRHDYLLYWQSLNKACRQSGIFKNIHKEFEKTLKSLALPSSIKGFYTGLVNRETIVSNLSTEEIYEKISKEFSGNGFSDSDFRDALQEWKSQIRDNKWSEYDLVLQAYLGIHLSFLSEVHKKDYKKGEPIVGCFKDKLTHIAIDEAQDISIGHAKVFELLLEKNGTLTFAGDLHQRVLNKGFFDDWKDLRISGIKKAIFSVNFRQTKQIGIFLKAFYFLLFGMKPVWNETKDFIGPSPRALPLPDDNDQIVQSIADEVRFWRKKVQDSTIGILWVGENSSEKRNISMAEKLEQLLDDLLIPVSALGGNPGVTMRTNQVILSSVQQIKGLEFDIVIFIDLENKLVGKVSEMSLINRNSIYVAISRAKYGLSALLPPNSDIYKEFLKYSKIN
ncbi:MAG: hypothetical protein DRP56_04380 [Planctomycetota bacterium]|nr:MAG: hypothetical protein DRP56_04380 [Planctomycetota bacterium]